MDIRQYELVCKTGRWASTFIDRTYKLAKVIFNRDIQDDRNALEEIYERGVELSGQVNRAAASDVLRKRGEKRLKIDGITGFLAEWCWKYFLNDYYGDGFVDFTDFDSVNRQIDLLINSNEKRIEVRSSNIKNGVQFGLCSNKYQFHVVGPYQNLVKAGEMPKDFYVMVLYPFNKLDFFDSYYNKKIVEVDLTCGATRDMMTDENIFDWVTLEAKESHSMVSSKYKGIKFRKSIDTIDITNLMNE